MAPIGLGKLVEKAAGVRRWNLEQAKRFFNVGIVILAALYTGFVYQQAVIGPDLASPAWAQSWNDYREIEQYLESLDPGGSRIVMVNNPPGYFAANQKPAIVIPSGDMVTVMGAAKQYHAGYLILDKNYPQGLKNLYDNPGDRFNLDYLTTIRSIQIYQFSN